MDNEPAKPAPARWRRRDTLLPLLAVASAPLLGRATQAAPDQDRPPVFETARHQFITVRPAKILPSVMLADLKGRPARVAPVPGKVMLINLWATWCDACRLDLPLLERFKTTMGYQVEVAAITTETIDRQRIRQYLDRLSIRALPIFLDPEQRLAGNPNRNPPLPIYGMPVTYLVTPSGVIAGYMAGVADWLSDQGRQLLEYFAQDAG